jgi:hypothetical protein
MIGVNSDAVARPQNAAGGNQAASHPCVDGVHAEAISGRQLRNFQLHTRCPYFHQITHRRQTPEKKSRFAS